MGCGVTAAHRRFWTAVAAPDFQSELNGLFWIDDVERESVLDYGWSCREHAWATALLARSAGIEAFVINGQAAHVVRTDLTAGLLTQHAHSWVMVGGMVFDFSPKPLARLGAVDVAVPKIAFSKVMDDGWGAFSMSASEREFARSRAGAAASGNSVALYWAQESDTPLPSMIEDAVGYINSPLTDILKKQFDHSIYAKALLHLDGVLHRRRAPLAGRPLMDQWEVISRAFDRPISRAIQLADI